MGLYTFFYEKLPTHLKLAHEVERLTAENAALARHNADLLHELDRLTARLASIERAAAAKRGRLDDFSERLLCLISRCPGVAESDLVRELRSGQRLRYALDQLMLDGYIFSTEDLGSLHYDLSHAGRGYLARVGMLD